MCGDAQQDNDQQKGQRLSHALIALHALEPVVQYAACFVGHGGERR